MKIRSKQKRIFLDYASATPVLPEVKQVMEKYWSKDFYNPNAIYEEGMKIKIDVDGYRAKIARILGVAKETIIFTSGGTEANTWAIRGVKPGRIVVEQDSHPSVLEAAKSIMGMETTLISSVTTDNKLGRKIREERKKGNTEFPLLHVDASQTAAYFNVGLDVLSCDLLTLDSAKLYGPKGIGALVVKRGVKLEVPPIGTPAVSLIAGFTKALEIAVHDRAEERKRLHSLSTQFVSAIRSSLPEAEITQNEPNIINVFIPASPAGRHGVMSEYLVLALDRAGVLVSAGPACNSNKPEPLDTPVRISLGRFTTRQEVKKASEIFCRTVRNMLK
ncbi:MAG: aminotransferase class V-fold PLP-dependent enzyme [bacterium]|nr:aminotransferase class V-fold PLP-dependent enzyme [bacterium]